MLCGVQPFLRTLAGRTLSLTLALLLDASVASAQQPPPAATGNAPAPAPAPAPSAATPAPAPGAYPYGQYPYPYPYQYPYQGYRPPTQRAKPRILPYRDGQPIPPGYYLDESIYRGPTIAGAILVGAPYAFGLALAAGFNFTNQSGWLALPALGPFITAAARHNTCPQNSIDTYNSCSDDSVLRSMLVLDGITQTAGAILFIWGVSSHHKRLLLENSANIVIAPTRVGSGYGLGVAGRL